MWLFLIFFLFVLINLTFTCKNTEEIFLSKKEHLYRQIISDYFLSIGFMEILLLHLCIKRKILFFNLWVKI